MDRDYFQFHWILSRENKTTSKLSLTTVPVFLKFVFTARLFYPRVEKRTNERSLSFQAGQQEAA